MGLPRYDDNPDFETCFEPKRGPGFFPGAGGYFHGCCPGGPRRIAFFGTDFGTQRYWEEQVTEGGGEKRTQATLHNLRCLVEEAGIDPCSCHLTNAVLALAKRDDMTGNASVYGLTRYRDYLELCGDFHKDWIFRHKPELVVLMGKPNIDTYRRLVFSRALRPVHSMLEAKWADLRAPWTCVYEAEEGEPGKELVKTGRGQPDVLWMFHPSFRHANPQFPGLETRAEKKKRREQVWETVVSHLRKYA